VKTLKCAQACSTAALFLGATVTAQACAIAATPLTNDVNAEGLPAIAHPNLELHCVDLSQDELRVAPVALVHAALFFEHAGLGRALDNALSLVTRGGKLSAVLQLPEREQQNVTTTSYASMQTLVGSFSVVDVSRFRALLDKQGFRLLNEELRPLPTGKTLWLGIFSSAAIGS
jgi:hypothetical protein